MTTKIADRPTRTQKRWKPDELECLSGYYGLMPDKRLAGRLHRTESGMIKKARYERISRKNNFYTARTLAQVLGIPTSRTIILWGKKGWLKGRRSGKSQSKNRLWRFMEYDVILCLKKRPWLVDLECMERHYFRSIVQEEWDRDPWYTGLQARTLLGMANATLFRYVRQGSLQVEKKSYLRSSYEGGVIVRDSAIQAFLKQRGAIRSFLANGSISYFNSKGELLTKKSAASIKEKVGLITSGYPVKMSLNWLLECPSCGQLVQIATRPELSGPQVREQFLTVYVNGKCIHGSTCQL